VNKNKIKIALVNVFFAPQSIGGATRVLIDNFNVLKEKYNNNFELTLFTSDSNQQEKAHNLDSYMYQGSRVYRSSILFRENMDWHAKDEEMKIIFQKFLDFEKPDVVHFHCIQRLTGSIVEACIESKIPYFITLHDAWWISDFQFLVDEKGKVYPNGHIDPYEKLSLPNSITNEDSIKRKLYLQKLLCSAKKIFSVSDSFLKIYEANGVQNIVTTKNGISDSIEWKPKNTEYTDKVVCGHIGGMSEHKGYDILKKAVSKMKLNNLEFLIVDHSKDEGYISIEEWGKTKVTFIGQVKQENIVELYGKIDVLFAPSIWPESYGLVTREASACGCWIVASNLGGIGEDVEHNKNGFVIAPKTKELQKILSIIDKDKDRFKTIAKSIKIRFSSEQVKELVEYYNDK